MYGSFRQYTYGEHQQSPQHLQQSQSQPKQQQQSQTNNINHNALITSNSINYTLY